MKELTNPGSEPNKELSPFYANPHTFSHPGPPHCDRDLSAGEGVDGAEVVVGDGVMVSFIDPIERITRELIRFRDEREWAQFHDSKNLVLAISIEAAE